MNKEVEELIRKSYYEIKKKEKKNSIAQGLSGAAGFPFTFTVDICVIFVIYIPMFKSIMKIFNRKSNKSIKLFKLIKNISSEILFDIVVDKILGNMAVVGIYFNVISSRTITWRLGTLFTMLAARGDDIDESSTAEAVKLIRLTFPQNKTFRFEKPMYSEYKDLVSQFYDISQTEFSNRISQDIQKIMELPDM